MMRLAACCVLAPVLAMLAGTAAAQRVDNELRLSVSATSDYVRNGLSQSASGPAARLAADFEMHSGLFVGGYLASVEFDAEQRIRSPRDLEFTAYVGHRWRRPYWTAHLTLSHYSFPDLSIDYDYTQAAANFSLRNRYFFEIAYSDDYLAVYGDAWLYRAGTALPLPQKLEAGLNAGEAHYQYGTGNYSFWDIGLSRAAGRFALDLRYHDNTHHRTSILGEPSDANWVFSVTYAIAPRAQ